MRKISRRRFLAGAAAVAATTAVPAWLLSCESRSSTARPKHVILVDWDGFDPDYLGRAPTPNIDALTGRGSLSTAEGTYPAISNPSRASMSTGAYPEVHGNAAYYLDAATGGAVGETRFLAAETVTEALASEGKTVAAVQWYMVQDRGTAYGDPGRLYAEPGGPFERRVDAAIEILNRRPVNSGGRMVTVPKVPDFLAVYGSDLDAFGETEGPESPNIVSLLGELDRQLGRLVEATREAGIYDETAFLLTSDHGMSAWERPLTDEVLAAISAAGYSPEVLLPGGFAAPTTEVAIVTKEAARIADVTLLGSAATPEGRSRVRAALEGVPQVARVLDGPDLRSLRAPAGLGDFVVEAEPPWGFAPPGSSDAAARGAHGSTREMRVPLLLSGAGVRPGVAPRDPRLVDVAPTVCALLGARPPADAQGRVLTESLDG